MKTRYSNQPSNGGESQLYYREIQTPAYAASVNITLRDPRSELVRVLFATITGSMTLTADTSTAYDGDQMVIKLPMDATGHTVTFSTGFTVTASTIVGTASSVCVVSFMFDSVTESWVERERNILFRTPVIMGDYFVEEFSPQIGSYSVSGTAQYVITPGNMALSNGDGTLDNLITIDDFVINDENVYVDFYEQFTDTSQGKFGPFFTHNSINTVQPQNITWGLYYFSSNNTCQFQVYNSALNSLLHNSPVSVTTSDQAIVRMSFAESSITLSCLINNVAVDTFTYPYNLTYPLSGEIKPNAGKITISAPNMIVNVKKIVIGSNAWKYSINIHGDSIVAGYYAGSQANRDIELLRAMLPNCKINPFSGAADNHDQALAAKETNSMFEGIIEVLRIGTNDAYIDFNAYKMKRDELVNYWLGLGRKVVVVCLTPRNDHDYTNVHDDVIATYTGVPNVYILNLFTPFLDTNPSNPTGINPTYSPDGLHFTAAGEILSAQLMYNVLSTIL